MTETAPPGDAAVAAAPALRDYALANNLGATTGAVFLTGTQALVRLLLMQRARDVKAGLCTAGFVSGYRGSPLGMVDQQLWKAGKFLKAAQVEFLPAINEDLAATAVLGTQRVALDPERRVEVSWDGQAHGSHEVAIQVLCADKPGLLALISQTFNEVKCGTCRLQLYNPSIHFMCGHSFHENCLETLDCPIHVARPHHR